jgi:hypothetical protein
MRVKTVLSDSITVREGKGGEDRDREMKQKNPYIVSRMGEGNSSTLQYQISTWALRLTNPSMRDAAHETTLEVS